MTIISITKTIITVGPLRPPSVYNMQTITMTVTTTTTIITPEQIQITTVITVNPTAHDPALKVTDGQNPRL
jgi:hypothetical protein